MISLPPSRERLETLAETTGLSVLAVVQDLPLPAGLAAVVLLGNVGPDMWRAFSADLPALRALGERDPLDAWSRQTVSALAESLQATALFPFDGPPYLPFQRWAQASGQFHPTPLGPLIHPQWGMWFAFRGALGFAEPFPPAPAPACANPCDNCADKPCLTTCPVSAPSVSGYDVAACVGWLADTANGKACRDQGCAARRACPVGLAYHYAPEQASFHTAAFLAAHGDDGFGLPRNR